MHKVIHKHKNRHAIAGRCRVLATRCGVKIARRNAFDAAAALSAITLMILVGMMAFGGKRPDDALAIGRSTSISTYSVPTLTLNLEDAVELDIKPNADGQFGRKRLDVVVGTNNSAGYNLQMWANNDTLEQTLGGQKYKINPLQGSTTCLDEDDETCAAFPQNQWGYRLASDAAYSSVTGITQDAPRTLADVKEPTGDEGGVTTLYFGAKINNSTPTGRYKGVEMTFVATTNVIHYSITYRDGNAPAGEVEGSPDEQIGELEPEGDTNIDLTAVKPKRKNYEFMQWCSVMPTFDEAKMQDKCEQDGEVAPSYDAGGKLVLDPTKSSNITLYAMWKTATPFVTFNFGTGINKVTVAGKYFTNFTDRTGMTSDERNVASNGGQLQVLAGETYTVTAGYAEGYEAASNNSITMTGDGVLSGNNYTAGSATAAITLAAQKKTNLSLTITMGDNVTQVDVKTDSAKGTTIQTLKATGTVTGLTYDEIYYLVPTFEDKYTLDDWVQGSDAKGELKKDTNSNNATYKIGDGTNAATITAKLDQITMQTMSANDCTAEGVIAVDSRDSNKYLIKKMKDGSCWMVQNLRLGKTSAITLYSTDTNLPSGTTSWELPALSTAVPANDTNSAKLYAPTGTTTIYNGVTNTWDDTTDNNERGVLYNYAAASAESVTDSKNTQAPAPGDICPKKWHLPSTNSATSDVGALIKAYDTSNSGTANVASSTQAYKDFNTAFRSVRPGYFYNGAMYNQGTSGYWWTSTPNSTNRYYLSVDNSDVSPVNNSNRYRGFSVRCVFGG